MSERQDLTITTWGGSNINDGTSYTSEFFPGDEWGLPEIAPQIVERDGFWPVLGGMVRPEKPIVLRVTIENSASVRTLRDQLLLWFDPEDETSKALAIQDSDGGNGRYVNAVTQSIRPIVSTVANPRGFEVTLIVDGDPRWRGTTTSSDSWALSASSGSQVINNPGTDYAYPVFKLTPGSAKSEGLTHKQFIPVKWRSENAARDYPVRLGLFDTATWVAAGSMQADGDDFRLFSDGTEKERWLVEINTGSTYIWSHFDFTAAASAALETAIPSTGTINSIEIAASLMDWYPDRGTLQIESEIFTYTSRDVVIGQFLGITRGAKNSSSAAHAVDTTVFWIQHEVEIAFGNASLGAPVRDDTKRPVLTMSAASSNNTQWDYETFGHITTRFGRDAWRPVAPVSISGSSGGCYSACQFTLTTGSLFQSMGIWIDNPSKATYAGWRLDQPCGLLNAQFVDMNKKADDGNWSVRIEYWPRGASWWTDMEEASYTASPPSACSWDTGGSVAYDSSDWDPPGEAIYFCAFFLKGQYCDIGKATLKLNDGETPLIDVASCAVVGDYELDAILKNDTTGDYLTIKFAAELGGMLEVDTDQETVTWDPDGSNQFQAVDWSTTRKNWLRLRPGNNTLSWEDVGTTGITIVTEFEPRYY